MCKRDVCVLREMRERCVGCERHVWERDVRDVKVMCEEGRESHVSER